MYIQTKYKLDVLWIYSTPPILACCFYISYWWTPLVGNIYIGVLTNYAQKSPWTLRVAFCTHHNPFDNCSLSLGSTQPAKRQRAKTFNPSLDIWNFKIFVNILSPWIVNAICLELYASTFAAIFGGHTFPSLYVTCLCMLFNIKWLTFQSPLIYQNCFVFEA